MSFAERTKIEISDYPNAQAIMADVEQIFSDATHSLYKARNQVRLTAYKSDQIVIKAFALPKGINWLVYGNLRKSKARRSFENSIELNKIGICTPLPIGYRETYRFGGLAESFYVSTYVEPEHRLEQVLHGDALSDRKEILEAFGRFVFKLHDKGVLHRDLSPGNVLINTLNDTYQFCLVDINRMRFGELSEQERFQNFAMLWASDADLRIILDGYSEVSGLDRESSYQQALAFSQAHKERAERKERIKRMLGK
jgi:tRNA A-37 threonylcarbamoyl transferase component Bud32